MDREKQNLDKIDTHPSLGIDLTRSPSRQSNADRLLRLGWTAAWASVAWLPRPFSLVRIGLLRLFGARLGGGCLIEAGVKVLKPWNLEMGDYVTLGRQVEVYNYGKVRIGAMCLVSQYCFVCTGSHDYSHPYMPLIWRDIEIGRECWLAAGVFVGPGVAIGDGTVVAARSVVTKTLPPHKVCGGNPCRIIKERIVNALS